MREYLFTAPPRFLEDLGHIDIELGGGRRLPLHLFQQFYIQQVHIIVNIYVTYNKYIYRYIKNIYYVLGAEGNPVLNKLMTHLGNAEE